MRSPFEGKPLHKVSLIQGPGNTVVRCCTNCGASWKLGYPDPNTTQLAWVPIEERDGTGKALDVTVDIRGCSHEPVEEERVTQQLAVVQPVNQTKPASLCYCPTCRVKQQHFPGDENCYCIKCKGKHPHKTNAA